jgi:hypothetical protein
MSDPEIVSDEEIEAAFGNANFGGSEKTNKGRLGILLEGLGNIAQGYSTGSQMRRIILELGLASVRDPDYLILNGEGFGLIAYSISIEAARTALRTLAATINRQADKL